MYSWFSPPFNVIAAPGYNVTPIWQTVTEPYGENWNSSKGEPDQEWMYDPDQRSTSTNKWQTQSNPLRTEKNNQKVEPVPGLKRALKERYLGAQIQNANANPIWASTDTNLNNAEAARVVFEQERLKEQYHKADQVVEEAFAADFQAWLTRRGSKMDHVRSGWWPTDANGHPTDDPGPFMKQPGFLSEHPSVKKYIHGFQDAKADFFADMAKLKAEAWMGVDDWPLEKLYLFYKYCVRGAQESETLMQDIQQWQLFKTKQVQKDPPLVTRDLGDVRVIPEPPDEETPLPMEKGKQKVVEKTAPLTVFVPEDDDDDVESLPSQVGEDDDDSDDEQSSDYDDDDDTDSTTLPTEVPGSEKKEEEEQSTQLYTAEQPQQEDKEKEKNTPPSSPPPYDPSITPEMDPGLKSRWPTPEEFKQKRQLFPAQHQSSPVKRGYDNEFEHMTLGQVRQEKEKIGRDLDEISAEMERDERYLENKSNREKWQRARYRQTAADTALFLAKERFEAFSTELDHLLAKSKEMRKMDEDTFTNYYAEFMKLQKQYQTMSLLTYDMYGHMIDEAMTELGNYIIYDRNRRHKQ